MKIYILISLLSLNIFAKKNLNLNEEQIFYHLHQATSWAELYHERNSFLSSGEMDNHLSKIKYNNRRLVDSLFYRDFLALLKIQQNLAQSNIKQIEAIRERIHTIAEKNKIKHKDNWRDEFLIIR